VNACGSFAASRNVRSSALAGLLLASAFLLGLGPGPVAAQSLGRLFFTPQQREDLDRRRQANIQEAAVVVESLVTVNGQVSRSSGKTTIWLNGVPQADTRKPSDPAKVNLPGAEGESSVRLKIGQTLDKTRGEIKDQLGEGRIVVQPGGAKR
jgi:hypothetical protein